jgi:5-methyltetrahydropteroyltriglutamate--homocysteine methyltransferase
LEALRAHAERRISDGQVHAAEEAALRDTINHLEATGSPVITDGEQTKPSFATYPLSGLENLAADGVTIPFADGHTRQLPRLTKGPFRYGIHAVTYLKAAQRHAHRPVKQAVISASALSLLYPQNGLNGYPREAFLEDLIQEAERDIRESLEANAACVQVDFTEGRLALKLDPSGGLLNAFIELNNRVLDRFSDAERQKIGVHTCPGGDHDSTHSADVDYLGLLPSLFRLNVGRFYIQLASQTAGACWLSFEACLSPVKGCSLVSRTRSIPEWRVPTRCATAFWKPLNYSRSSRWERPTIAASHLSLMTRPRRGTQPSQK